MGDFAGSRVPEIGSGDFEGCRLPDLKILPGDQHPAFGQVQHTASAVSAFAGPQTYKQVPRVRNALMMAHDAPPPIEGDRCDRHLKNELDLTL